MERPWIEKKCVHCGSESYLLKVEDGWICADCEDRKFSDNRYLAERDKDWEKNADKSKGGEWRICPKCKTESFSIESGTCCYCGYDTGKQEKNEYYF